MSINNDVNQILSNGQLHIEQPQSRRDFLAKSGAGFGALALTGMLASQSAAETSGNALVSKNPHFKPTAKRVIFLFMEGGPSHLDLFDRKPLLQELAGKPIPESFEKVVTAFGETKSPLLASKRTWKQHGQSGSWVSDWLPHTAECIDDIAVLRSCWANGIRRKRCLTKLSCASRPALDLRLLPKTGVVL